MSRKEIVHEIEHTLNNIPDSVLKELLGYLNKLEGKTEDELELSKNLFKVLSEDYELLERLSK